MVQSIGTSAALAGVPIGVQAHGIWAGRRQLFVRFAAEAETATMYTSAALAAELKRLTVRANVHSISICGHDALANEEFLAGAFEAFSPPVPVLLDTDGQRPESIEKLRKVIQMVQVTFDDLAPGPVGRALETVSGAVKAGIAHAVILAPKDEASDGQLIRLVEQVHAVSPTASIVLHPAQGSEKWTLDRRWSTLMERATALHADTRLGMPIPPPTGIR